PLHAVDPNSTQQTTPPSSTEVTPASPSEETSDEADHLVKKILPDYPDKAVDKGIEGPVVLHVAITKKGKVRDVKVVSGNPLLAKSAVKAVKHWEYRPFLQNGAPADVEKDLTINFALHSAEEISVCPGQQPLYTSLRGKDPSAPSAYVNDPAAPTRV